MTATYDDPALTYDDADYIYNGRGGIHQLEHLPIVTVEIDFDTNPDSATRAWTDVTEDVQQVQTARGRQHELDRTEAGTATVVLDNREQKYDPNNSVGPYYGGLRPMRRVRVQATWAGLTYGVFHGLIETWPQQYAGSGTDAFVTLRCVDLFKSLNLIKLTTSYSQEMSGARVGNVLDDVGWPVADRNIDIGQSTVQNVTLDGPALDHLQKVADSENGLFYISKDGDVRFIERHALILADLDTVNLTWGDSTGENPYEDITIEYGDSNIWNEVEVSSQGVATQTASDATSQARYFRRTLSRTGLLLTSTTEQQAAAEWMLSRFAEPNLRITRMVLDTLETSLWPHVLGRDLGDKIRVRRDPPGNGDVIQQDSFVESISFAMLPDRWDVTWSLSPMAGFSDYWILGDSVQGVLGTTTRLAY